MSKLRLAAISWIGFLAFLFSTSFLQEQDKDSGAKRQEANVVDAAAKKKEQQEVELPTASQVIEKYIFAMGGYEVLGSLESRHIVFKGTSSNGTELESEAWQKRGQYSTRLLHSGRWYLRGVWTDGSMDKNGLRNGFAWESINDGGFREKTGDELQEYLRRRTRVDSATQWETDFKSIECIAQTKVRGVSTWQLRFVDHDGKEIDRYFDTKTGYCLRRKTMETFSGSTSEVVRDYMDHKAKGDLVVPMTFTISYRGVVDRWRVESFEHDVEIPEHVFEIPDLIQRQIHALQDSQASANESADHRPEFDDR